MLHKTTSAPQAAHTARFITQAIRNERAEPIGRTTTENACLGVASLYLVLATPPTLVAVAATQLAGYRGSSASQRLAAPPDERVGRAVKDSPRDRQR